MNAVVYSYSNCIAVIVIVIISSGIPAKPIIPKIKKQQ